MVWFVLIVNISFVRFSPSKVSCKLAHSENGARPNGGVWRLKAVAANPPALIAVQELLSDVTTPILISRKALTAHI